MRKIPTMMIDVGRAGSVNNSRLVARLDRKRLGQGTFQNEVELDPRRFR